MKDRIAIVFTFVIIGLSQNLTGQNSVQVKGEVSFFDSNEITFGANIETFEKKELVDKAIADPENGSFDLTTTNKIDKIVISFPYCYPTIIENINKLEDSELDLNNIKIYEIPNSFTTYATKEVERQHRKESRQKFRKLKKGLTINSGIRTYQMQLKKRKGKYAFFIDFYDFQN